MSTLLVVAGVAVALGAALQSATGFGFALVAAPLVFAALPPQEAIGTLLVLGTEVSLLMLAAERRRPRPLVRDAAIMVASALPGALAGVAVLRSLDAVTLQLAVTAGVIATLLVRRLAAARTAGAPRGRPRRPASRRVRSARRPTRAVRRCCCTSWAEAPSRSACATRSPSASSG